MHPLKLEGKNVWFSTTKWLFFSWLRLVWKYPINQIVYNVVWGISPELIFANSLLNCGRFQTSKMHLPFKLEITATGLLYCQVGEAWACRVHLFRLIISETEAVLKRNQPKWRERKQYEHWTVILCKSTSFPTSLASYLCRHETNVYLAGAFETGNQQIIVVVGLCSPYENVLQSVFSIQYLIL